MKHHSLLHFARHAVALSYAWALAAGASDSFAAAQGYLERNEVKEAIVVLKSALQERPDDVDSRLLLGEVYLREQQGALAEKEITRAGELGADAERVRLDLVESLVQQGRYQDAAQRLAGLDSAPRDASSRVLILAGTISLGLKRLDEAQAQFSKALLLGERAEDARLGLIRVALARGNLENVTSLADALAVDYPRSVDALLIRSDLYRRDGDLARATELLERAVAANPSDPRALTALATAKLEAGDAQAAEGYLLKAESIRPDMVMSHYLRGWMALEKRDWQSAQDDATRLLQADPGDTRGQVLFGLACFGKGQYETAVEYLKRVVSATPSDRLARRALGAAYLALGAPGEAVSVLDVPAVESDQTMTVLLGQALLATGDRERGQRLLGQAADASADPAAMRARLALEEIVRGKPERAGARMEAVVTAEDGQAFAGSEIPLALSQLKEGRYDEALVTIDAFRQRDPNNPMAYNVAGMIQSAQGKTAEAEANFQRALKIAPGFTSASLNLGGMALQAGDLERAASHFKAVLAVQPRHVKALLGLAEATVRRGDNAGAVALLEQAQEASPSAPEPGLRLAQLYLRSGESGKALKVTRDLVANFPNNPAAMSLLARSQSMSGDFAAALLTLQTMLGSRPDNPGIHYLIAETKLAAGDPQGARVSLEKVLAIEPNNGDALVALIALDMQAGRIAEALGSVERLRAATPDSPLGDRLVGTLMLRLLRFDEAVAALERAVAKDNSSEVIALLADAYRQAGNLDKAIAILKERVAAAPGDNTSALLLAGYLDQAGQLQDALTVYERLPEGGADDVRRLNAMARVMFRLKDARAEAVAGKAYELAPDDPELADTYGWIAYHNGKTERGIAVLQRAYAAAPSQGTVGYHLAAALAGVGRTAEARQILNRLLSEYSNLPNAKSLRELLSSLGN